MNKLYKAMSAMTDEGYDLLSRIADGVSPIVYHDRGSYIAILVVPRVGEVSVEFRHWQHDNGWDSLISRVTINDFKAHLCIQVIPALGEHSLLAETWLDRAESNKICSILFAEARRQTRLLDDHNRQAELAQRERAKKRHFVAPVHP